jgi:RimJ/RimL family protein N-acetyltransferase
MTDVLGICTSWDADACTVQPESGAEVRIPLADIVSGKPVPPRPVVEVRGAPATSLETTPRDAQVRAFALFPDLETEQLGHWVLRRSPTATARRANSVLAFGPSGVAGDVDAVVRHYDRPVAAVLPDSPEERLFRDRGWGLESTDADTSFQIAGTAAALRALPASSVEVEIVESAGRAEASIDDRAGGYAGSDGEWLGFGGLWVDPAARRSGLALAVVGALLDWGASQGATTAYLQVLGDNVAALRLYERLGFREHHRYRYLAP